MDVDALLQRINIRGDVAKRYRDQLGLHVLLLKESVKLVIEKPLEGDEVNAFVYGSLLVALEVYGNILFAVSLANSITAWSLVRTLFEVLVDLTSLLAEPEKRLAELKSKNDYCTFLRVKAMNTDFAGHIQDPENSQRKDLEKAIGVYRGERAYPKTQIDDLCQELGWDLEADTIYRFCQDAVQSGPMSVEGLRKTSAQAMSDLDILLPISARMMIMIDTKVNERLHFGQKIDPVTLDQKYYSVYPEPE